MKLTKAAVRVAMGLIPTDMVFYKDEKDKLYRLRYLKNAVHETSDSLIYVFQKNAENIKFWDITNHEKQRDSPR